MAHVVDAHGVSLGDAIAMLRALPAYDQQQRPALLARFFSAPIGGETTLPRHLTAEVTALQTAQLLEIGMCRFLHFRRVAHVEFSRCRQRRIKHLLLLR